MKRRIVFQSARIFDGESETLRASGNVVVEDGRISEISERPPIGEDEVVDCGGRVLMPGLIDAHVHVYAAGLNIVRVVQSPVSYLAHFAARFLSASLNRGFTTLRDVGGADIGLALAIKDGLLDTVPRLYLANRRPWRLPSWRPLAGNGTLLRLFVSCRPVGSDRRRRGRGAQSGARRTSARGFAHQDHGVRRSRITHRSARPLPVLGRGDSRRCRGS